VKALGIDPGVQSCALAVVNDQLAIERVAFVKVKQSLSPDEALMHMVNIVQTAVADLGRDVEVFVVEGQQVYGGRGGVPANDLLSLANVAGALLGYCAMEAGKTPGSVVYFPRPRQWKGQQPKDVNQANTLTKLGLQYAVAKGQEPYCYPTGCAQVSRVRGWHGTNRGDWKHISDAAGLALWGVEKAVKELR
jgi:hypothetical protein